MSNSQITIAVPRKTRNQLEGLLRAFDKGNFFFLKAVELINQLIDLLVGGGDVALQFRGVEHWRVLFHFSNPIRQAPKALGLNI